MTESSPVVNIRRLTFGYPPSCEPVVEDVSLEIGPREFLGIIGPNGGGKTTLLKLMLGLLKPQQGQIRVFGQALVRLAARSATYPRTPGSTQAFRPACSTWCSPADFAGPPGGWHTEGSTWNPPSKPCG